MSAPDPAAEEIARLRARVAELESRLSASPAALAPPLGELLWESLITGNPDFITVFDRELRIAYINRCAPGYELTSVLGRSVLDFVVPEHRARAGDAIRHALATGEKVEYEAQDPLRRRWYRGHVAPLLHAGEVVAVLGIYSDVTERRAREETAHQREASLRLAMQQMPAVFWTTDREMRLTSLQGAGIWAANMDPERHVGMLLEDFFAGTLAPIPAIPAHRLAVEGRSAGYVQEFGGRMFQANVEPLRDAAGAITGVIGVALDVTELKSAEAALRIAHAELEDRVALRTRELEDANRKLEHDIAERERVERELRESEDRFRTIAEAISVPIAIATYAGKLLYVNLRTLKDFGWDDEQKLVGHLSREFFHRPDEFDEVMAEFAREGSIRAREVKVRLGDGSWGWISLWMEPTVYEGQEAIFGSFMNITARKEAEEDLQRERNLLMRLVELHERDRQLIAYEIHDGMVQDLTGAGLFLEAALYAFRTKPDEAEAHLAQGSRLVRESINEARRLIGGLSPPILDEAGVVPAIANLIREMQDSGGPRVDLVQEGRLERLAPALEMAIYRIVQESLNNVRFHSGAESAFVSLVREGDALYVVVQDRGRGFDKRKTKKKRYGLTGIQERARLLGGEAAIESALGHGTTVRVRLPLVDLLQIPRGQKLTADAEEDSPDDDGDDE